VYFAYLVVTHNCLICGENPGELYCYFTLYNFNNVENWTLVKCIKYKCRVQLSCGAWGSIVVKALRY